MWFTGLYETLQGRDHLEFQALASLAGQALAGAFVMFTLTYMASFRRHVRRSLESSNAVLSGTAEWTHGVLRRLDSVLLRNPVERAVFHFSSRTILRKVPFTCSYLPGKANLKLYWFPYVGSFLVYAYGMASIERMMLEYPARFVIFYTAAFAVLCYLTFRRRHLPLSERTVIFEEQPEPAVRALNLSH
jgi:hypothetical protein